MIVFFSAGQLGNQIFQYGFLEKIKNHNELIITSNCDYFDVFDSKNKNILFLNKYFRFFLRRLCKFLAKLKVISYIEQAKYIDSSGNESFECRVIEKKGLIKDVKFIEGFFQSEEFVNRSSFPDIKKIHIKLAKDLIDKLPSGTSPIAVHIRRGDYLTWNVLGEVNPSLPLNFYKKTIDDIQKRIRNPYFIFFSNDPEFVEENFADIENKMVSRSSVAIDFAAMTMCNSGIISNSTLAWWAAQYMSTSSLVLAPKFWLGWKQNTWYPIGIKSEKFEYIEV